MTPDHDFAVLPVTGFSDDEIAAAVSAMYDEHRSVEWLNWKHQDGPWGPSGGWAVCDEEGIVGLAFELPWRWRVSDSSVPGARLIDGGSVPRARGKGVFRIQVQAMLDDFDPVTNPAVATATATPEAAASHVKLGATLLDPIQQAYGPPPGYGSARLVTGDDALDRLVADAPPARLITDWTPAAMRWRIDPRAGYTYEVASLALADEPNGVVYRVASVRGMRVIVVLFMWGPPHERRRLLAAVARSHRGIAILGAVGDGALPPSWRTVVRRGVTHLCVWDIAGGAAQRLGVDPLSRSGWALGVAEVEGAM